MMSPRWTVLPDAGLAALATVTTGCTTGVVTLLPQAWVLGLSVGQRASPPPATVAVLMTWGKAAGSTLAVTVITGACALAATAAVRVQMTTLPLAVQSQPSPAAETKERPAGSTSRTVMTPAVARLPLLATSRV